MFLEQLAQVPSSTRGPRTRWEEARALHADPVEAVVAAAHGAQTVGELFYAGYQGAIALLFGDGPPAALLVTEAGGQHPRALAATVAQGRVSGEKLFVLADVDRYHVVVRAGAVGERVDLRVATVAAADPGCDYTPIPSRFLADVPHGRLTLTDVAAESEHEDAWARYVRPFRGVEDLTVLLAVCAARSHEGEAWLARVAVLCALARLDPDDPGVVLALAGVRQGIVAEGPASAPLAVSWAADSRILDVAAGARARRLEVARRAWATVQAR
ncbi:MAG: hypothetical protein H6734_02680 [Alphaproteobacteria bacterium]|nr:hypothetical protein [Alphaproteobacteria bacterium]